MGATAKTIILRGDKRSPESAEHHIEFPGGAVSVCRLEDGTYWAHITAHRRQATGGEGLASATTAILDGRLDYKGSSTQVQDLPDFEHLEHIAVRIGPPTAKTEGH